MLWQRIPERFRYQTSFSDFWEAYNFIYQQTGQHQWDTREGFRYFAYNTDSIPVKYLLRQTGLRMDTVARRD